MIQCDVCYSEHLTVIDEYDYVDFIEDEEGNITDALEQRIRVYMCEGCGEWNSYIVDMWSVDGGYDE